MSTKPTYTFNPTSAYPILTHRPLSFEAIREKVAVNPYITGVIPLSFQALIGTMSNVDTYDFFLFEVLSRVLTGTTAMNDITYTIIGVHPDGNTLFFKVHGDATHVLEERERVSPDLLDS